MTTATTTKALAKQIFAATYNYPATPFRSIGRDCFAWAMKEARRQLAEKARIESIPVANRTARIEAIDWQLVVLDRRSDYTRATRERRDLLAERRTLAASIAA